MLLRQPIGKRYNHYLARGIQFFSSLTFALPIWYFFYTQHIGMSLAWATFLNAVSMVVTVIFEVPSGTWADRRGRKKLFFAGVALKLVMIGLVIGADSLWMILAANLIGGFGAALSTGTLVSLIYDRYKENGDEAGFARYSRINFSLLFFSRAIGTIAGGLLYVVFPPMPYIAWFTSICVVWLLITQLYEPVIETIDKARQSTRAYIQDGRKYLMKDKQVVIAFGLFCVCSVVANIIWSLYQPLFESLGLSVVMIGWLFAGFSLLSSLGSYLSKFLYKGGFPKLVLKIEYSMIVLTCLCLIFLPGIRKLSGVVLLQITFGRFWPVMNPYINQIIPSSHRSTVNSIVSMTYGVVWVIAGGGAGLLYTSVGFQGVFAFCGLIAVVFGVVLLSYIRKNRL